MENTATLPAFGVTACLRLTVQIYRARWRFFVVFGVFCSLFALFLSSLNEAVFGLSPGSTLAEGTNGFRSQAGALIFGLLLFLVVIVAVVVEFAFYVMAAYDTRAGYSIVLRDYWRASWENLVPMFAMTMAAALLMMLGLLLLVLPGLWVAAVYCVVLPAVLVDRARFGAMGRSRRLTEHYRWSLLGLMFLIGLIILLIQLPVYVLGYVLDHNGFATVLATIWQGALMPLSGITGAVIHMRLVEIKEPQPVPVA